MKSAKSTAEKRWGMTRADQIRAGADLISGIIKELQEKTGETDVDMLVHKTMEELRRLAMASKEN